MKNIIKKFKVKTIAIGVVSVMGVLYFGKKALNYINDFGGEQEPLTDDDIINTLGIGGCSGFTNEEKTGT